MYGNQFTMTDMIKYENYPPSADWGRLLMGLVDGNFKYVDECLKLGADPTLNNNNLINTLIGAHDVPTKTITYLLGLPGVNLSDRAFEIFHNASTRGMFDILHIMFNLVNTDLMNLNLGLHNVIFNIARKQYEFQGYRQATIDYRASLLLLLRHGAQPGFHAFTQDKIKAFKDYILASNEEYIADLMQFDHIRALIGNSNI